MSEFTGDFVPGIKYDFEKKPIPSATKPGEFCKGKGVVNEPTKGRLDAYRRTVQKLYQESLERLPEDFNPQGMELGQIRDLMRQGGEDTFFEDLFEATVELCDGKPSREDLEQLPGRHRDVFCLWLQGEFNPEAYAAGIRNPAAPSSKTQNGSTTSSGVISGSQ